MNRCLKKNTETLIKKKEIAVISFFFNEYKGAVYKDTHYLSKTDTIKHFSHLFCTK